MSIAPQAEVKKGERLRRAFTGRPAARHDSLALASSLRSRGWALPRVLTVLGEARSFRLRGEKGERQFRPGSKLIADPTGVGILLISGTRIANPHQESMFVQSGEHCEICKRPIKKDQGYQADLFGGRRVHALCLAKKQEAGKEKSNPLPHACRACLKGRDAKEAKAEGVLCKACQSLRKEFPEKFAGRPDLQNNPAVAARGWWKGLSGAPLQSAIREIGGLVLPPKSSGTRREWSELSRRAKAHDLFRKGGRPVDQAAEELGFETDAALWVALEEELTQGKRAADQLGSDVELDQAQRAAEGRRKKSKRETAFEKGWTAHRVTAYEHPDKPGTWSRSSSSPSKKEGIRINPGVTVKLPRDLVKRGWMVPGLSDLGELHSLVYRESKRGDRGKQQDYIHHFGRGAHVLADPAGALILVAGPRFSIRPEGIVG